MWVEIDRAVDTSREIERWYRCGAIEFLTQVYYNEYEGREHLLVGDSFYAANRKGIYYRLSGKRESVAEEGAGLNRGQNGTRRKKKWWIEPTQRWKNDVEVRWGEAFASGNYPSENWSGWNFLRRQSEQPRKLQLGLPRGQGSTSGTQTAQNVGQGVTT